MSSTIEDKSSIISLKSKTAILEDEKPPLKRLKDDSLANILAGSSGGFDVDDDMNDKDQQITT